MQPSPARLFTDGELAEFQLLVHAHANVRLTAVQANVLAHQLLRALWAIRNVLATSSTVPTGSVDGEGLARL